MCLGDVDYDGYGDIAVGAPYEEESGGAVYIYNGNIEGVFKRYSQRLIGSDYSPLMRGFGISISKPRDINGDKYPDIAVGAYLSEKVVLLRTVPVVTLNVTLAYLQKIRLLKNATSFVIDMQVYYEGAYVPENLRESANLPSMRITIRRVVILVLTSFVGLFLTLREYLNSFLYGREQPEGIFRSSPCRSELIYSRNVGNKSMRDAALTRKPNRVFLYTAKISNIISNI